MALSTYPRSGLDQPGLLASLLGSFWQEVYGADGELNASLRGLGGVYSQAQRSLDEAIASVAYADVPLRHVEEWVPITILASDLTNPAFAVQKYGATPPAIFGSDGLFGVPTALSQFPVSIAPADAVPMLCDAIVGPAVCLVAGIDYRVDPIAQIAWLSGNPFANPLLSPTPVFDANGNQVDQQLILWAWRTQTDVGLLQQQIGYALGATFPSTCQARDLVVALVDALVNGTSDLTLRRVFAALYDAPLARCDGEVVEVIVYDSGGLMIATDRYVYRYTAAASPVVAVGQSLEAGDPLSDTLQFANLSSGAVPAGTPALTLGPALLGSCYQTGLVFGDFFTPIEAVAAPLEG